MSILLESRRESESREGGGGGGGGGSGGRGGGIVQQPGPFYNGNPSSSIWGSSFWKNAGLLDKAAPLPYDFGVSNPPPPPVETLASERSKDRPEVFVFGSVSNAARSSSSSPDGDQAAGAGGGGGGGADQKNGSVSDRKNGSVGGRSGGADRRGGGGGGGRTGIWIHSREPKQGDVERVESMLHDLHIRAPGTAAPPAFSNVAAAPSVPDELSSAPSFLDEHRKVSRAAPSFDPHQQQHRQQQFAPDQQEFAKTTTAFTFGTPTPPHHQTGNPRPRFSKLRKSSHPAKGKGLARGESIDRSFSFSSRAASPDSAANFQAGEPSIAVDQAPVPDSASVPDSGSEREASGTKDEQVERSFEAAEGDDGSTSREIPSTSVFVFTSMKNAVPEIPERRGSEADAHSLAADLTALKVGDADRSSDSVPVSSAPAPAPAPAFVFGAGSTQTRTRTRTQDETPTPAPAREDQTFVFRSSGAATSPSFRKKRGVRRVSSRARGRSTSSTSATDEQGSPMDFSPCPDTGARLSPQVTEQNSEAEETWNFQFQFYPEQSDEMENLSGAAADLSLGSQSDDPKEATAQGFAFTASSSPTPARRRTRRTPKPASSKIKPNLIRSASRVEVHGMDLDNAKIERDEAAGTSVNFVPSAAAAAVPASRSSSLEQVCEKWRLRGNQAYASGDFPKAEEYYTLGVNSVSPNETLRSSIHVSMLCYSNRAATRMVVGRIREALADCLRAIAIDPDFLRVRLRAGSCHLALGDVESAMAFFQDCFNRASVSDGGDSKIAAEASEGIRKSRQMDEYFQRAWELLLVTDFASTLAILNEALLICPYSEIFLELKAHSLLALRKHNEVIQLCDQTLVSADRNWIQSQQSQVVRELRPGSSPKIWRSWATSKALFYMGKLKDSLDCLHKLGDVLALSGDERISYIQDADLETLSQFIGLVQQLLQYKAVGNEAFQAGRHTEAVEHYTAALALNSEARPFTAVLFCNRAAASQALGHIADAIADSSRAVALNSKYLKAISRRVTLHTLIRDFGQACSDLERLITLLELEKSNQELKQARERLANAEEDLRKSHPVDHYLILGLVSSASPAEIKKAYRKLALRHHPDKAAQLVVRNDGGEDGRDVGEEIRNDAERLFKLIGEAYAILSDPAKRSRYDAEEDLRKLRNRGASNNPGGGGGGDNHRYDRSHRRQRDRWEAWSGYAHQYQRWQNGPDAAQPDTYARQSRYASAAGKSAEYSWDDIYS